LAFLTANIENYDQLIKQKIWHGNLPIISRLFMTMKYDPDIEQMAFNITPGIKLKNG
jgi:hypothetical protein